MEKMSCISNGTGHPTMTVTGTITKIDEDLLGNKLTTTVPAKSRLASEEAVEEIIGRSIIEIVSSAAITETLQAPADNIIGQGSNDQSIYHPKKC
jgi:hypothetical protein